ncbi:hypothetical protein [Amycolatopsis lurida]|uniref:hypothetical protein n=1 Tax=Amycolatopsis lurida TaxID=31959 RepID=UPI003647E178
MKHLFVRYRRSWLRGDLPAGVTVAAPPEIGLWAVIGPLAAYAALPAARRRPGEIVWHPDDHRPF